MKNIYALAFKLLCLSTSLLPTVTYSQNPGFSGQIISYSMDNYTPLGLHTAGGEYFDKTGKKSANNELLWGYQLSTAQSFQLKINFVEATGDGGCVVALQVRGTLTCQGATLLPHKPQNGSVFDVVIVKFNSEGQRQWWYRISDYSTIDVNTFQEEFNKGLVVRNGKIYWLTEFKNSLWTRHFNGNDLPRIGYLLVCFNLDGAINWVHHHEPISGSNQGSPELYKMDVNNNHDIAILGFTLVPYTINLGNNVNATWGSSEVRAIKINSSGVAQMAIGIDKNSSTSLEKAFLCIDDAGNMYYQVSTSNSNVQGPFNPPRNSSLIGKINANGTIGWSRIYRYNRIDGMALAGNYLFVSGIVNGTKNLQSTDTDSISLSPPTTFNTATSARFFARYALNNGNLNWHIVGKPVFASNSTDLGVQHFVRYGNDALICVATFAKSAEFGNFTWSTSQFSPWIGGILFVGAEGTVSNLPLEAQSSTLALYPNPSHGVIYANSANTDELQFTDINGKVVKQITIMPGTNQINHHLPAGMYLVRSLRTAQTQKIVVE